MKTPNPTDDPSRDFSYMDERRKKQNASGWLEAPALTEVGGNLTENNFGDTINKKQKNLWKNQNIKS